jgi:predicted RNA-binding protein Jag
MVDFVELQGILRGRLENDRELRSVETVALTLDAAISDAAALLNIPIRHLGYEIIERGSDGFMGVGKKEWRIRAYERASSVRKKQRESLFADDEAALPVIEDKDGEAFVHFRSGGEVLLKITAPSGKGREVPEIYVKQLIEQKGESETDDSQVSKTIREALGAYIKVGSFKHNPLNDASALVEIITGEMKAFIQVTPPSEGGCDISFERYINVLKSNRVIHGIKEDFLRDFVDKPVYREKILAAEGTKPIDGKDAYIHYNFETDLGKVRLK